MILDTIIDDSLSFDSCILKGDDESARRFTVAKGIPIGVTPKDLLVYHKKFQNAQRSSLYKSRSGAEKFKTAVRQTTKLTKLKIRDTNTKPTNEVGRSMKKVSEALNTMSNVASIIEDNPMKEMARIISEVNVMDPSLKEAIEILMSTLEEEAVDTKHSRCTKKKTNCDATSRKGPSSRQSAPVPGTITVRNNFLRKPSKAEEACIRMHAIASAKKEEREKTLELLRAAQLHKEMEEMKKRRFKARKYSPSAPEFKVNTTCKHSSVSQKLVKDCRRTTPLKATRNVHSNTIPTYLLSVNTDTRSTTKGLSLNRNVEYNADPERVCHTVAETYEAMVPKNQKTPFIKEHTSPKGSSRFDSTIFFDSHSVATETTALTKCMSFSTGTTTEHDCVSIDESTIRQNRAIAPKKATIHTIEERNQRKATHGSNRDMRRLSSARPNFKNVTASSSSNNGKSMPKKPGNRTANKEAIEVLYERSAKRQIEGKQRREAIALSIAKAKVIPDFSDWKIPVSQADRFYYRSIRQALATEEKRMRMAKRTNSTYDMRFRFNRGTLDSCDFDRV